MIHFAISPNEVVRRYIHMDRIKLQRFDAKRIDDAFGKPLER